MKRTMVINMSTDFHNMQHSSILPEVNHIYRRELVWGLCGLKLKSKFFVVVVR